MKAKNKSREEAEHLNEEGRTCLYKCIAEHLGRRQRGLQEERLQPDEIL